MQTFLLLLEDFLFQNLKPWKNYIPGIVDHLF